MSALGFDTSNYTTSAAWTDGERDRSVRQLLYVKDGERGIRQSDGVFQHMKLMPSLFEQLCSEADIRAVSAVGVSTRPRTVEGSYMPVFLAGEGFARVAASSLGVPLYEFSHQDGHVMAGIYSCGRFDLLDGDFLSVHLSGGTTEILRSRYVGRNFTHEIIGGTRDISAGQLIDRVGVRLGLSFPAGKEAEKRAKTAENVQRLAVSMDGAYMNFSGAETQAMRFAEKCDADALLRGVMECVRDSLIKTINSAIKQTGAHRVLIVGGVASNEMLRGALLQMLDAEVFFAKKEYSTDNAVGIAYLAHLAK
jgi:N6-L-threonylcarbamoyladenine synthase